MTLNPRIAQFAINLVKIAIKLVKTAQTAIMGIT